MVVKYQLYSSPLKTSVDISSVWTHDFCTQQRYMIEVWVTDFIGTVNPTIQQIFFPGESVCVLYVLKCDS